MKKKDQKVIHLLEKLGLSDKESRVYFAMLELGQTTALNIARVSEIKRTSVYDTIERLQKRGLVTEQHVGLKRKFVAESPRVLQSLLHEQQQELEEALPGLVEMHRYPSTEGSVKIYEGAEGLKNALSLMLKDLQPGDPYYVIANIEGILELIKKFFYEFAKKRDKYPILLKTLLQDQKGKSPLTKEYIAWAQGTREEIMTFMPEQSFSANIVVTPYRVMMPHIKPFTGAIVIENPQAVDTHQQLFRMLWNRFEKEGSEIHKRK